VGWIRLDRKITDNWLWEDKPFSKGQAWIDLILMANHEDNKFLHGNEITVVKRGSRITSISKLSKRWGWSRKKVFDFLNLLESEQMLIKKSNTKETHVTIVKYDDYQTPGNTEETPKKRKGNTEETPKSTNNNITRITNNNIKTYSDFPTVNDAILSFIEFRKKIKAPMTDRAVELMIKELHKLSADSETQIEIINQSIMQGWKGIFALKQDQKPQSIQNKFNQYPQRQYSQTDFTNIERKLINKGLSDTTAVNECNIT
jgi:hypothetical protein